MSAKTAKRQRRDERAGLPARTHEVAMWIRRAHLGKLRQEFARRLKIQHKQFPKMKLPCETCAFRTSADFTDGDIGFLKTTLGVVHALATDKVFYCHAVEKTAKGEYQPRYNEKLGMYEPCAGWFVLQSTMPEPLDVRACLGDWAVEYMIAGNKVFNEEEAKP